MSGRDTSAHVDEVFYEDALVTILLSSPPVEPSKLIAVARCHLTIIFFQQHELERRLHQAHFVQIEHLLEELAGHFSSKLGVT